MKEKTYPLTHRGTWAYLHGEACLYIEGEPPPIEPLPLKGPLFKSWPPGSKFDFLGGNSTSASFEWMDFRAFGAVEYLGQIDDGSGDGSKIAVFQQADKPQKFGWNVTDEALHWGTNKFTSRVIELHRATLAGEEIPPAPREVRRRNAKPEPEALPQTWPEWRSCPECFEVKRYKNELPTEHAATCKKCNVKLEIFRARIIAERPTFDQLQKAHGSPHDTAPPPAID